MEYASACSRLHALDIQQLFIDSTFSNLIYSKDGTVVCCPLFVDGMPLTHLSWLQHKGLPSWPGVSWLVL